MEAADAGNYTCEQMTSVNADTAPIKRQFRLQTVVTPRVTEHSSKVVRTKISQSVQLYCIFEAHPVNEYANLVEWKKDTNQNAAIPFKAEQTREDYALIVNRTKVNKLDERRINVTLDLVNVFKKDNGTYTCKIKSPYTRDVARELENAGEAQLDIAVLVLDTPQMSLDFVKAVGARQIFLNWTVNDGNSPVINYFVQFQKEGDTTFTYYNDMIPGKNRSYVLSNFEPDSNYKLRITPKNDVGSGPVYNHPHYVRTLKKDPIFVPEIDVKGSTRDTITIGWAPPPNDIIEFIHYYQLDVFDAKDPGKVILEEENYPQNSRNLPYMFDKVSADGAV